MVTHVTEEEEICSLHFLNDLGVELSMHNVALPSLMHGIYTWNLRSLSPLHMPIIFSTTSGRTSFGLPIQVNGIDNLIKSYQLMRLRRGQARQVRCIGIRWAEWWQRGLSIGANFRTMCSFLEVSVFKSHFLHHPLISNSYKVDFA